MQWRGRPERALPPRFRHLRRPPPVAPFVLPDDPGPWAQTDLPHPEKTIVLDDFVTRMVSRTAPGLLPDRFLHHAALSAAEHGCTGEAERLFELAAAAYRRSLDVEGLARLRVHQRMVRARAAGDAAREAEMMLEIVRGVNRLERLESIRWPHEMRDARTALSEWLGEAGAPEAEGEPRTA